MCRPLRRGFLLKAEKSGLILANALKSEQSLPKGG
jgi:hypothetical protein